MWGTPLSRAAYITQSERRLKILALLCVLLAVFVAAVQAVHVHTDDSNIPSHECTMCAVAHAGILNTTVSPPAPLFVETTLALVFEPISKTSEFVSSLHIRPPPVWGQIKLVQAV